MQRVQYISIAVIHDQVSLLRVADAARHPLDLLVEFRSLRHRRALVIPPWMPLTAQHFISILSPSHTILQFLHARLHHQSILSSPRRLSTRRRRRARRRLSTHRRVHRRIHRHRRVHHRSTTQRLDRTFARRQRALEPSHTSASSSRRLLVSRASSSRRRLLLHRLLLLLLLHRPPHPPTDTAPKRLVIERTDVRVHDVRARTAARDGKSTSPSIPIHPRA